MTPSRLGQFLGKSKERGLTMVETALTLTIFTVLITGIVLAYNSMNRQSDSSQGISDLIYIRDTVRSLYVSQSNYERYTSTTLLDADLIPGYLSDPSNTTGFRSAFKGDIDTGRENNGCADCFNAFFVSYDDFPVGNCSYLIGNANKLETVELMMSSSSSNNQIFSPPYETNSLVEKCSGGADDTVSIKYVFK
jgi:Tfp pilus assembly protein PilV